VRYHNQISFPKWGTQRDMLFQSMRDVVPKMGWHCVHMFYEVGTTRKHILHKGASPRNMISKMTASFLLLKGCSAPSCQHGVSKRGMVPERWYHQELSVQKCRADWENISEESIRGRVGRVLQHTESRLELKFLSSMTSNLHLVSMKDWVRLAPLVFSALKWKTLATCSCRSCWLRLNWKATHSFLSSASFA
jgi:hypothetical protein